MKEKSWKNRACFLYYAYLLPFLPYLHAIGDRIKTMKHEDSEKKLQRELKRMDKEDQRLASRLEKDLEKRDSRERDYLIDEKIDTEWMLYQRDYTEEAAQNSMETRLNRDGMEESASISELERDVDKYRNKRYKKHLRK